MYGVTENRTVVFASDRCLPSEASGRLRNPSVLPSGANIGTTSKPNDALSELAVTAKKALISPANQILPG